MTYINAGALKMIATISLLALLISCSVNHPTETSVNHLVENGVNHLTENGVNQAEPYITTKDLNHAKHLSDKFSLDYATITIVVDETIGTDIESKQNISSEDYSYINSFLLDYLYSDEFSHEPHTEVLYLLY